MLMFFFFLIFFFMTGRVTSKLEKLWIPVNELILRQKGEPVVHLADALIATVPDG